MAETEMVALLQDMELVIFIQFVMVRWKLLLAPILGLAQ